jgi:uncharacterized protein (DUF1015 family)
VPYDTVDTEEARALAAGNAKSFLRIGRPEIDLPKGTDIHSDAVYAKAAANFQEFQKQGYLVREDRPYLYVYRLQMGKHVQRGVVCCCHIEDYEKNVIRKHEKTRADKEDDRTRHVKTLNANSGPIFLTYRDVAALDRIVAETEQGKSFFDFTASDGIRHTIWRIPSSDAVVKAFAEVPVCYIADGHHRAAAAARAGMEKRAANTAHTGQEEYNWFLAVLFPAGQLQILPYNRCVGDLNGLSSEAFLAQVRRLFSVADKATPTPKGARHCSMYLAGRWYDLSWGVCENDPVAALDVSFLQDRLLSPVLGIRDPRTDKRIEFIGGIRGAGELTKRVDSGRAAVAFSLYPVTVAQVMAIADAGRIMPPKSTWFEPKLRSGLLVHTL